MLDQPIKDLAEKVKNFPYAELRSVADEQQQSLRASSKAVEAYINLFSDKILFSAVKNRKVSMDQLTIIKGALESFKQGVEKSELEYFQPRDPHWQFTAPLKSNSTWMERFHFIIEKYINEEDLSGIKMQDYGSAIRQHRDLEHIVTTSRQLERYSKAAKVHPLQPNEPSAAAAQPNSTKFIPLVSNTESKGGDFSIVSMFNRVRGQKRIITEVAPTSSKDILTPEDHEEIASYFNDEKPKLDQPRSDSPFSLAIEDEIAPYFRDENPSKRPKP